jgi:crossover junction endodeoxyribonuclease RuvC
MPRSSSWRSYKPGVGADSAPEPVPTSLPKRSVPYRVLGLDPGSRATGYGVIDCSADAPRYVASGTVRAAGSDFAARLREIYAGVADLMTTYAPDEIAIEKVFVNRNVDSALKLGQARGAALAATFMAPVPVAEYAPREVKLAVVGTGAAEKVQVQKMVSVLLGLSGRLAADAADALAIALCHAHAVSGPVRRRSGGGR